MTLSCRLLNGVSSTQVKIRVHLPYLYQRNVGCARVFYKFQTEAEPYFVRVIFSLIFFIKLSKKIVLLANSNLGMVGGEGESFNRICFKVVEHY